MPVGEGERHAFASFRRTVPDDEVPFQWDFTVSFEPELTVGAGFGIKDVASLGIESKATTPVIFNFTTRPLLFMSDSINFQKRS